ncbi:MAG: agmatinase [Bacteroidetes bacterium]|jgi:agmatinase|nr:agmatinase [Bacteroidota bacterium]
MKPKTNTFAGIPKKYQLYTNSKIVLQAVPYDQTSTWGKGADKGPDAFLEASENMELFDIPTQTEIWKQGIHLAEPLNEFLSPDKMVEQVENWVQKYLNDDKFVTLIGGEHSISIGSIRAMGNHSSDFGVLQIDAHADLRAEYEGSIYNHACAMYEAYQKYPLVQVGIRSMDKTEWEVIDKERTHFMHDIAGKSDWMQNAIDACPQNIYLTIDLDAFDSSLMPATGTPEPGGFSYYEVYNLICLLAKQRNILGFDIVELAPHPTQRASAFLAAKLYYQTLSQIFFHKS